MMTLYEALTNIESRVKKQMEEGKQILKDIAAIKSTIQAGHVVQGDFYQVNKAANPTYTEPTEGYVYDYDKDLAVLREIFKTPNSVGDLFLQRLFLVRSPYAPMMTDGYELCFTYIKKKTGRGQPTHPIPFSIKVNMRHIANSSHLEELLSLKYEINSARFLKSILNTAMAGNSIIQYYRFEMAPFFAVNILSIDPTKKARPKTYWFHVSTIDTLDIAQRSALNAVTQGTIK